MNQDNLRTTPKLTAKVATIKIENLFFMGQYISDMKGKDLATIKSCIKYCHDS